MSGVNTSKYGLQQVFTIKLFDTVTGQAYVQLEDMKESKFTVGQTTVYVSGGIGNPNIIGFDHSKTAKITGSNALITDGLLATQLGSDVQSLTNSTDITYTDIMTVVSADTATTTFTATGTAGAEIGFVFIQNADGSLGQKFTQAGTVGAGLFTYTSGTKQIAFNTGEVPIGTKLVAFYKPTASSAKKIASYTDVFSKSVRMVADCLLRDAISKQDYQGQIIFETGKVQGAFEWAVSADGNPSVQSFEIDALKPGGSNELWSMIIYDEADLS